MSSLVFGERPATFRRVAALIANLPGDSAFAAALAERKAEPVEAPPPKRRRASTQETMAFFGNLFGSKRKGG